MSGKTIFTAAQEDFDKIQLGAIVEVEGRKYVVTEKTTNALTVYRHRPWVLPLSFFAIGLATGYLIYQFIGFL